MQMKNLRPVILWLLIVGILIALWNNFSSLRDAQKGRMKIRDTSHFVNGMCPLSLESRQPGAPTAIYSAPVAIPEPAESILQGEDASGKGKRGKSFLKEFAVLTGFARGNLKDKDDYKFVPAIFRFGFDLKRFLNKISFSPKELFEFQVEPFVSAVISPDTNAEFGANLLFKYGYFFTKKFCPYIEAGAGVIYITQHTREQSTQYNFIPQVGAGISYFLNDNLAVSAGYRYRHLSNASIKAPNKGINVDMVVFGISWYF